MPVQADLYPLAILDCGANSLRLALETSAPGVSTPTYLHQAHNAIIRTRLPGRTTLIGSDIQTRCSDYSGLSIRSPVERGIITDWVAQKAIWDTEIARALFELSAKGSLPGTSQGKLLEGWSVVLVEPYLNLPELESGLDALFFEEYGVKSLWRTTAAQLANFAPMEHKIHFASPVPPVSHISPSKQSLSDTSSESESATSVANLPSVYPQADSPAVSSVPSSSPLTPARSSGRQKRPPDQPAPAVRAKTKLPLPRVIAQRRPEACLIVDIGHSATHVIPIILDEVAWWAVRRLEIGGKLMTNLLKELISFKQWDMTEETWLVSQIKEKSLFVAASNHEEDRSPPSGWNPTKLFEVGRQAKKGRNPLEQEFILPEYPDVEVIKSKETRYGRLSRGPGCQAAHDESRPDSAHSSVALERSKEDAFIADAVLLERILQTATNQDATDQDGSGTDSGDDEDDSEYRDSDSDSEDGRQVKRRKAAAPKPQMRGNKQSKSDGHVVQEGEEQQTLTLSQERWQIPELLFNPQQIGLEAMPLPSLIQSSIMASSSHEAIHGLMFANISLIGGLSHLPGLRRRMEKDLTALAPDDFMVRVRTAPSPELAAVLGAEKMPRGFLMDKLLSRKEWEDTGTAGAREKFRSWSSKIVQAEKANW